MKYKFNFFWVLKNLCGAQFLCPPDEGGEGDGKGKEGDGAPDLAAQLAALKAENEALKAKTKPVEDDLNEKARKEREAKEKDSSKTKRLENAIAFNMKSADFLKANAGLLPSEAAEVFAQAEKETFADHAEKSDAIKSGLIQSFFAVQENVDLLTPGQKTQLDEYLKLTKNEKQARAQNIYDMIFEPAFETLRKLKKAAALSKGLKDDNGGDSAYREKMRSKTMKHYGLEK